ncbi:MAG: protein phosphatase 2C domain-containing protein [Planctomycetota bacterium]
MPQSIAFTDSGCLTTHNEDRYWISPERGIYLLSDGIGGSKAGEVASQMLVDHLPEFLRGAPPPDLRLWLISAIRKTSQKIDEKSKTSPHYRGMATTLTLLYLTTSTYTVAQVGDSRAYLLRNNHLQQITQDHTVAFELYRYGSISKEALRHHPNRSLLTRTVGKDLVVPELFSDTIQTGDRFLLCTDGLVGELTDNEILEIMQKEQDLSIQGKTLLETAKNAGGRDNITLILVRL